MKGDVNIVVVAVVVAVVLIFCLFATLMVVRIFFSLMFISPHHSASDSLPLPLFISEHSRGTPILFRIFESSVGSS